MNCPKSLPSSFFASYVIDENIPECISRICTIRINKISITKSLLKIWIKEFFIAFTIRDSRQLLRSSPIVITDTPSDVIEIDVDFTFCLKYSHYMGRKTNILNVYIQRRRVYNNKVVTGHKTIALTSVDLAWIFQNKDTKCLKLYPKSEKSGCVTISLVCFNTLPAPNSMYSQNPKGSNDQSTCNVINDSSASDNDDKKNENSNLDKKQRRTLTKVLGQLRLSNEICQSILSLADKRNDNFSDGDSFGSFSSIDEESKYHTQTSLKPTIKPHFPNDTSLESNNTSSPESTSNDPIKINNPDDDCLIIDKNISNDKSIPMSSDNIISESSQQDHLFFESIRLSQYEDILYCLQDKTLEYIYFFVTFESLFNDKLTFKVIRSNLGCRFLLVHDNESIKALLTNILSRLQNQINSGLNKLQLKICIIGQDQYLNMFLEELIQLSVLRISEIFNKLLFLFVPIGQSNLANHLSNISPLYNSLFNDNEWQSFSCDNIDVPLFVKRISTYIHHNISLYSLALCEVSLKVLNYSTLIDEKFVNLNIPFFGTVNVGYFNEISSKLQQSQRSSSLIIPGNQIDLSSNKKHKRKVFLNSKVTTSIESDKLTVDYWIVNLDSKKDDIDKVVKGDKKEVKLSRKSEYGMAKIFINDLSSYNFITTKPDYLCMILQKSTSSHEQKVKLKRTSVKQNLYNISYLVCATKSQTFSVEIDGRLFTGVKYFSVSPNMSTVFNFLPIGLPIN